MKAVGETSERFKIFIGVVGPVTDGMFTDLVHCPVDEYLDSIDRSLCTAAAANS